MPRRKSFACGHVGLGQFCHRCKQEQDREKSRGVATVREAVDKTRSELRGRIVFGDDVALGVERLASHAGPPAKVERWLGVLAEMTDARRNGGLGTSEIKWLQARGVVVSGESETTLNSPRERQLRTWSDGFGGRRMFSTHLKPTDGTSPDTCVRIYFDFDDRNKVTIVGWVGRHPA